MDITLRMSDHALTARAAAAAGIVLLQNKDRTLPLLPQEMCIRDRSMSVPSRSKRYMERLLLKNIFMGYLPNAALFATIGDILVSLRIIPVSYTHLDVYKRQSRWRSSRWARKS